MAAYPSFCNNYSNVGIGNKDVVRAGKANLLTVLALNTTVDDIFVMLFNSITLPITGQAPTMSIVVYKNNGTTELTEEVLGQGGLMFTNGLTMGISTSAINYQPASNTACVLMLGWV